MKRVSTLFCACSLVFALSADHAHGAPASKTKTTKGVMKAPTKKAPKTHSGAKSKGKSKVKAKPASRRMKPAAKGPGVSKRKGVLRLGLAPKGTKLDNRFQPMETKSSSSGKVMKVANMGKVYLSSSAQLTPTKPNNGGMFLSGYHVTWRAGSASWMEPGIKADGDGFVSIRMPLTDALAGKDLKVECVGEFAETMSVRGVVIHGSGSYTTNSAQFSYISDTLKFLVQVPTTNANNPAFSISMGSEDNTTFVVTSCKVEKV